MKTIETPINKEKVAALVADAFQDSEYFLPKIALQDQLARPQSRSRFSLT